MFSTFENIVGATGSRAFAAGVGHLVRSVGATDNYTIATTHVAAALVPLPLVIGSSAGHQHGCLAGAKHSVASAVRVVVQYHLHCLPALTPASLAIPPLATPPASVGQTMQHSSRRECVLKGLKQQTRESHHHGVGKTCQRSRFSGVASSSSCDSRPAPLPKSVASGSDTCCRGAYSCTHAYCGCLNSIELVRQGWRAL